MQYFDRSLRIICSLVIAIISILAVMIGGAYAVVMIKTPSYLLVVLFLLFILLSNVLAKAALMILKP